MSRIPQLFNDLCERVDAAQLALFRILFGAFMFYEIGYYQRQGLIQNGIVAPRVLFKYEGFEWITPASESVMTMIMGGLGMAALLVAIGLLYRVAIVYFFLGYSYVFFMDKGFYNNHMYLFILIALLLCFMPANRKWSLDRKLFRKRMPQEQVPRWTTWILMVQVSIVYVYGGLAKLNPDWLFRGEPIRSALRTALGNGSSMAQSEAVVQFFVWGGLLFDLTVPFLLLQKRTRMVAIGLVLTFNLMNHFVLFNDIGIFPWFMIAATLLFFKSEEVAAWFSKRSGNKKKEKETVPEPGKCQWVKPALVIYLTFHLLFPLRHWGLPGNVDWTSIGQRFSWRMKTTTRDEQQIRYFVETKDGRKLPVKALGFINNMQMRTTAYDPRMAVQFAKFLRRESEVSRGIPVERVTSEIVIKYNGREQQLLFPPDQDLSAIDADIFDSADWMPEQPEE